MNAHSKTLVSIICFILSIYCLHGQTEAGYAKAIKKYRKQYLRELAADPRHPATRSQIKQIRFFPADEKWRVTASFSLTPDSEPFDIATSAGTTKPYTKYGVVSFELQDALLQLAVYQSLQLKKMPGLEDYLFIPFNDQTNGESTYGGGRYLDIRVGDIQDGKLILDFNKAYNPYCAYSTGFQCPIPPVENQLGVAIEAGEMAQEH